MMANATHAGPASNVKPRQHAALPERYEMQGLISFGTFGEIWRVFDRSLTRVLAMKVLKHDHAQHEQARARFLAEARITAGLQHPGIVAIHDHGELEDGQLWFTMKEVRGDTLTQVIAGVHAASGPDGFGESKTGWTFRRVLDAYARVTQAVAYAHSRGVMHRDLKPDNVLVGEFGEVLVVDWGLARDVASTEHNPGSPFIESAEPDRTSVGDIIGTPAYMPPEQANGRRELHGPHSDVFSLGAILYQVLTGRPPWSGTARAVLGALRDGAKPTPLAEALRGGPPVPPELITICETAMSLGIEARYPNADVLSRELADFLDGARRRDQALEVLAEARARAPAIGALREKAARRRADAQALLASVRPFDPIEKKRPAWEIEDDANRLGREATLGELHWLQTVHGALSLCPDLPEAHALLADHYRGHLSAAELEHRHEDAARFEALLRAHDRGRYATFLHGDGALTLLTDPPGAVVRYERYEQEDRRLVPKDAGVLGKTPLRDVPLPRGSYRLRIQAPDRAEVLYPVAIDRDSRWHGIAPGDTEPTPIVLPRAGELGPDDCYVPAGWCWIGGDPEAGDSLSARRVWIDAFVIRRFPVTNAEYLEFLNDLVATGREEEALLLVPRTLPGKDGLVVVSRTESGAFALPADTRPDASVVYVDWHRSMAYARWYAERSGKAWRLANELEREKAARGVDARRAPWGNHFDATFACALDSHQGEIRCPSVTDYPLDASVYEVRGLSGNTRDWCINVWEHEGPALDGQRLAIGEAAADDPGIRAARGGAWSSPLHASRSACRFGTRSDALRMSTGFRLVRSFP